MNTADTLSAITVQAVAAAAAVRTEIETLRARITAARARVEQAEHAPLPPADIHARIAAAVADLGAAWLTAHGSGLLRSSRYGGAVGEVGRPGSISLPDGLSDWFGVLCVASAPEAEGILRALVDRLEFTPGTTAAERPAHLARLRAELAEVEAAEEAAIDAAAAVGITVAHRPEVVTRRENERRERELIEERAADVHRRQAQLEAWRQQRATERRVTASSCLDVFKDRPSV